MPRRFRRFGPQPRTVPIPPPVDPLPDLRKRVEKIYTKYAKMVVATAEERANLLITAFDPLDRAARIAMTRLVRANNHAAVDDAKRLWGIAAKCRAQASGTTFPEERETAVRMALGKIDRIIAPLQVQSYASAQETLDLNIAAFAARQAAKAAARAEARTARTTRPVTARVPAPPPQPMPVWNLGDFKAVLSDPNFQAIRSGVDRMLSLMSAAYAQDPEGFSKVFSLNGKGRVVFAMSRGEIDVPGKPTASPKIIPNTPYWVATKLNTEGKKRLLTQTLKALGYADEVIVSATAEIK